MDTTTLDPATSNQLNTILEQNGGSLVDVDQLTATIAPFMIIITVLSIVVTILWIVHLAQKMRVNRAIFEIRDMLREMTGHDKKHEAPQPAPEKSEPTENKIIA